MRAVEVRQISRMSRGAVICCGFRRRGMRTNEGAGRMVKDGVVTGPGIAWGWGTGIEQPDDT